MTLALPHTQLDSLEQAAANDLAIAEGIAERPEIALKTVDYAADGATTGTIRVGTDYAPQGVLLVRAYQKNAPDTRIAVESPAHFLFYGNEIRLPEPSGLTAATIYTMTFLLIGRQ